MHEVFKGSQWRWWWKVVGPKALTVSIGMLALAGLLFALAVEQREAPGYSVVFQLLCLAATMTALRGLCWWKEVRSDCSCC